MRISTGVPGFDELVDGGLLPRRLYVLSGPPGSGKTTFSVHFVNEGAANGDKCLYMSMHETKNELLDDMSGYEIGFEDALNSNRVHFMNVLSNQSRELLIPRDGGDYRSNVKNMTTRIVNFIDKHDIDRLVIDSTMLLRYFYSDDERTFIQFVSSLKQTDATTLLVSEMTDPTSYSDEHYLAHGVVFFHNYLEPTGMERGLQLIKMRGTNIDADIRKLDFSEAGLQVYPETKVAD
jgi:KaiC/GvpD/RAD55 family RecA-like ATPase